MATVPSAGHDGRKLAVEIRHRAWLIGAGGWGIHVPHPLTWSFERDVERPRPPRPRYREIADSRKPPDLVRTIAAG